MKKRLDPDCPGYGQPARLALLAAGMLACWLYPASLLAAPGYQLPLKASSNNRYLVDQSGTPFLVMGDAPQALLGNLNASDMQTYMADRQSLGFNALWVNLLCASYTGCNSNGTTYDGVAPFTSGFSPSSYNLSRPNSAYFSRVDSMVNLAATYNLVVFLDPIETGGWLVTLENNGSAKAFNYGVYIGNRYKTFTNIVWLHGNDFQSWSSNSTDNNLVKQVMAGIASVDSNHLQTIELDYLSSYSNQDSALGSLLTLDSAYTYFETYDIVLQAYNSPPTIPTFLVEANYEYENNFGALPGSTGAYVLREQAYWTMLSGGAGQLYGNHYTWTFTSGWQSNLDSPGALEIQYINQLFGSVAWWDLVPDTTHQVVTSGYGTYDGSNQDLTAATYCTASGTASGSLALTYCPNATTLTVNFAAFSGPVTAKWYDPSNGSYTAIPGSPFPNSGAQNFTTPGNNQDGDPDWVLYNGVQVTPESSAQISTTASGLAYSRVSQTFNGTVTIRNISGSAINGPIQILFTGLTASVTLVNATGALAGAPYLTVPGAASLIPGQSATVNVQFKDPSNATINFAPVIYSGSFN
jgi:hypothetical protein